jgi:GH18 family chitinase
MRSRGFARGERPLVHEPMRRRYAELKHVIAIVCALALVFPFAFADRPVSAAPAADAAAPFRVIGYYSGDLFQGQADRLQADKLTHIIYAFLIPLADGGLAPLESESELAAVIEKARAHSCKVFIALGGWSYRGQALYPVFESAAASEENRARLIENVRDFVKSHDLDGVEIDWEYPNARSIANYEALVAELQAALHEDGKELTAALNGAWSSEEGPEASALLSDDCLARFDFINVMAYDMNGEEHSPLWFAETSLDYWLNRGLSPDKLVLGLPLYARPSWMQYRDLTALDPANAYRDFAETSPLPSYYNGLNTLREKLWIALGKAGGVMLFDVNEDAEEEASVVRMIDETLKQAAGLSAEERKKHITVILNDRELPFSKDGGMGLPFINASGRILMPLRKSMEAAGAQVAFDEKTKTVDVDLGGVRVQAPIGEAYILVNGARVATDTEATLQDGRTFIPLRAIFSAFGYEIAWHAVSRTVYLHAPDL